MTWWLSMQPSRRWVWISIGRYTVYTVIPRYHYSYRLTSACVNGIIIVYGSINRPHAGGGVVNTCAILRYHFTVPDIRHANLMLA